MGKCRGRCQESVVCGGGEERFGKLGFFVIGRALTEIF